MTDQNTPLPPTGPDAPDNPGADPAELSSIENQAADCIDEFSGRLGTLDLARGLVDSQVSRGWSAVSPRSKFKAGVPVSRSSRAG